MLLLPSRLAPCHLPQRGRLWFSAQSKLVSPSGRDVAQRQRGLAPSLRELDCRLAARLREQPIICHASSELLCKLVCVLLLPSRLTPRHLPQRGRLWFSAQSTLSLPLGEMSRSDREGWLPLRGGWIDYHTKCNSKKTEKNRDNA